MGKAMSRVRPVFSLRASKLFVPTTAKEKGVSG
jgi:hypothetical protein